MSLSNKLPRWLARLAEFGTHPVARLVQLRQCCRAAVHRLGSLQNILQNHCRILQNSEPYSRPGVQPAGAGWC